MVEIGNHFPALTSSVITLIGAFMVQGTAGDEHTPIGKRSNGFNSRRWGSRVVGDGFNAGRSRDTVILLNGVNGEVLTVGCGF